MTPAVRSSADPSVALDAVDGFLRARPVEHNLLLSLLTQRAERGEAGRFWWAVGAGDAVIGFAFQSPIGFRAVLSCADRDAIEALVDVMAGEAPDLPGVMAEAGTAAAFAGQWAERCRIPVMPAEGQRLYRLGTLRPPEDVPGRLRQAVVGDRDLIVRWAAMFIEETGAHVLSPDDIVDRHLSTGGLWVWVAGDEPVSVAAASPAVAGVYRIGYVFTPPAQRGRGYAAACVAALSERARAEGKECVLYTQLQNPTSNGVYRRIGYEPVVEVLIYRFGRS